MNELIYSDIITELKKEISEIKIRISVLIQEKEDLEYNICPTLKTEYYEKIGNIEVQIRMLELTAEELKYRISIIQAALNRREIISEELVEEKVERKYSEYRKKVDEAYEDAEKEKSEQEDRYKRKQQNYEKYVQTDEGETQKDSDIKNETDNSYESEGEDTQNGQSSDGNTINDDEYRKMSYSQKIKEIYRRIVKKLHPDINPDITEYEKELFYATQEAYKNGNLERLEEIYAEIMDSNEFQSTENPEDDVKQLRELKERLLKKLHDIEEEIKITKTSFPYSAKAMLENPVALMEKQNQLSDIVKKCEEIVVELRYIYENLKKELLSTNKNNDKSDRMEE